MSTTVDQRVVQMQFDNAQFEKGVRETLNSLNKLNNTVENTGKKHTGLMAGLAAELGFVAVKAKSISDNVGQLNDRFSILGTFGGRIVENMTDSLYKMAVNCGKTLTGINSMTSGFDKFGQKTRAVATLMTATGASMEEVNKTLDDLQWFTDETSYNFTDMIDTMSKLSASGTKDLGKLLRMTEGFAMAGAKAGANAQLVSRGMFQISQAASRGYILYQDWMQALGTTNIATDDLKKKMIEAGGAAAIAAGAYQDFNGSLQKHWLTFDVFSKVMDQFTEGVNKANYANGEFINSCDGAANSTTAFSEEAFRCAQECRAWEDVVDAVKDALATGWSRSFELILGDANEVRGLFTGIANAAIEISSQFTETRNEILSVWRELGGRESLLQSFVNILNAIWSYVHPIKEAFAEVFGDIDGKNLYNATTGLEGFTKGLILTADKMKDLKNTFVDVFGVIREVYTLVKPFAKYLVVLSMFKSSLSAVSLLLGGGLGIRTVIALLKILFSLKIGAGILGVKVNLTGIVKVITSIIVALKNLGKNIYSSIPFKYLTNGLQLLLVLVGTVVSTVLNGVFVIAKQIYNGNILSTIQSICGGILENVKITVGFIQHYFSNIKIPNFFNIDINSIKETIGKVVDIIQGLFKLSGNDFSNDMTTSFNDISDSAETTTSKLDGVFAGIKQLSKIGQFVTGGINSFIRAIGSAGSTISNFLKEFDAYLMELGRSDTVIGHIIRILANIDWDRVLAFGVIALYLKTLMLLNNSVIKISNNVVGVLEKLSSTLSGPAGMIKTAFQSMAWMFDSITAYMKSLVKVNNSKIFRNYAIGIGLITASVIAFAYIPTVRLMKAGAALAIATGLLVGAAAILTKISKNVDIAGIAAIGAAFVGLGAILAEITVIIGLVTIVTTALIQTSETWQEALAKIAAPVLVIGSLIGIVILGIVKLMTTMATMSAIAPAVNVTAFALLKLSAAFAALGGSIFVFATAITLSIPLFVLIISSIKDLLKMITDASNKIVKEKGFARGLYEIAGYALIVIEAFAGMVFVIKQISNALTQSALQVAAGMLAFAGSLYLIGRALLFIGNVPIDQIGRGLLGLAGSLAILWGFIAGLKLLNLDGIAESMKNIGKGITGMSFGVALLMGAIALISLLPIERIEKGLATVGATLLTLAVAIKIIDKANIGHTVAALLGLVASLYLLVPLFALFGTIWQPIVIGVGIVSLALLSLAGSIRLLAKAEPGKVIPIVGTFIAAILSIGYVLRELSSIDTKTLLISAGALVGVVAIFSLAMAGLKKATENMDFKSFVTFAASILVFSGAVAGLTLAMKELASIPVDDIGAVAMSLEGIMLAFSVAIVILTKATMGLTLLDIGGLTLIMLGFAAAIGVLSLAVIALNGADIDGAAFLIGVFAGAMAGLIVVAGLFGKVAVPALLALAGLLLSIGVGVKLAIDAFTGLMNAILPLVNAFKTAVVTVGEFLVVISSLDAGNILKMSVAIGAVGLACIALGAGFTVAGAGAGILIAVLGPLGMGLTALGIGINVVANGIYNLRVALGMIDETAQITANRAGAWGTDLTSNYAQGLMRGQKNLGTASMSLAKTIAAPLHQSVADVGPLSTTDRWGGDLVQNIINGILSRLKDAFTASLGLGDTLKKGFDSGVDGIGSDTVDQLISNLGNGDAFKQWGASLGLSGGTICGNNFVSAASSIISQWSMQMQTKLNNIKTQLANATSDAERKNLKAQENSIIGKQNRVKNGGTNSGRLGTVSDMLDTEKMMQNDLKEMDDQLPFNIDMFKSLEHTTDGLSKSMGDLGSSTGTGGSPKGGGGGGKSASDGLKDAEEAAKKAAERLKELNKYTQNSIKTNVQYNTGWGLLLNTLGTLSPIQAAKDSINALAETIYQATLTGDEAAMTAEERAAAVAKAFNEAFDNIKTSVKNSMNLFEEFDFHLEKTMDGKTLLKNAESQLTGYVQLANYYKDLALKGFDQDIIAKVIDGGASELPKIKSMLKMTSDEVKDFNRAWADQDGIATFVASSGMAARAMATNIKNLRANAEEQRKNQVTAAEFFAEYDKAVASGDMDKIASAQAVVNQKAQELNMTVDQLRAISQNTGATADEILIKMIDNWENAQATVLKYNEVLKETKDKLQDIYEGQMDILSIWNGPDAFTIKEGDDEREAVIDDLTESNNKYADANERVGEIIDGLGGKFEKYGSKGQMVLEQLSQLGAQGLKKLEAFADANEEQLDAYFESVERAGVSSIEAAGTAATAIANLAIGGQEIYAKAYAELQNGLGAALANAGDPNGSIAQTAAATGQTIQEVLAQRISRETGYTTTEIYNSGLIDGFVGKLGELTNQATVTGESADQAIAQKINEANGCTHTTNFMMGMLKGIQDHKEEVLRELDELAEAMADLAAEKWDEHSPSKLTYKQARYFLDGMSNAFRDHGNEPVEVVDGVVHSVTDVMQNALSTANAILNDEVDFNPVITPVLDLSSVQNGSKTLSNLFNTDGFRMEANVGHVVTPAERMQSLQSAITPTATQKSGGNTFNYVQNNYSPKALSRLDIYRDTKNQFAQLKGLVTNNG